MTDKLLEIKNMNTYFTSDSEEFPVVKNINLSISKGETVAIVGESGCGKSVTSLSIMGLLPPAGKVKQGEILFNGTDLLKLKNSKLREYRGNQMSMVFQEPMSAFNPVLKIGNQMVDVLKLHKKLTRKNAKAQAINMLDSVGIPNSDKVFNFYPHELSGGMLQRVMIAISLLCDPELIIADEPTTALDVTIQAQILELMEEITSEKNTSMILITHDLGVVAEVAQKVFVMYAGEIVEEANVNDLFANPKHPYTYGLLNSIPSMSDDKKEDLYTIKGSVPSLKDIPTGCPFRNRCPLADEECKNNKPKLKKINNSNHYVSCLKV